MATSQGDDYATSCLLGHPYFKDNYKLVAVDLSKQQIFDNYPKANLDRAGNKRIYVILEEAKETKLDFSQ